MDNLDSKTKALGIIFLVIVALNVLQRTSLAVIPTNTNDFLGGLAVGLGIVLGIAWFAGRSGESNS